VFRAIASSTNERTSIAAVLPERACFGHSLYGCVTSKDPHLVAAVANSLPFDYTLRLRVSANVSPMYLKLTPIPGLSGAFKPILITASAHGSPATNVTDCRDFWPTISSMNLAVAEAYGLTPDDLAYILTTFPVLARKRPEFLAYLRSQTTEASEMATPVAGRS
jgi:hypothetical protein